MADDRLQLEEKSIILSEKEIIERNLMVQNRVLKLDLDISKCPDRKPTIKGNKAMRQHLIELRDYAQENPSKYYLEEKEKIGKAKIEEEVIGGKN